MDITTNKSWKYDLKKLESTSYEFKIVEHFFKTTSSIFPLFPGIFKKFQIWKVIEQNEKATADEKSNNLMLFHGTSQEGVAGILEYGFKNSEKGYFGEGVYMTEDSERASCYSLMSVMTHDFLNCLFSKSFSFIFVNEVLRSETLQTVLYEDSSKLYHVDTPLKNPFTKYMHYLSPETTEDIYIKDLKGRRYRNVVVEENSEREDFVADSKLVIPRYLILYQGNYLYSIISALCLETLSYFSL